MTSMTEREGQYTVKFIATGDLTLGRGVNRIVEQTGYDPTYGVPVDPNQPSVASGRKAAVIQLGIKNARNMVDIVVVSFHWGREFAKKPTALQRLLAHTAVEAGAALIIGNIHMYCNRLNVTGGS